MSEPKVIKERVYFLVPVDLRYETRKGRAEVLRSFREVLGGSVVGAGGDGSYSAKSLTARIVEAPHD